MSESHRPPLDLEAQRFLAKLNASNPPAIETQTVAQAREQASSLVVTGDVVHEIRNVAIPRPHGSLAARIYRPQATVPLPLIVFFHGGGWVLGSLDSHDALCRRICRVTDCAVMSVDYRLAPESKFPAAVEDCDAATDWAFDRASELGIDADRISVCGDSAGANLAAVTALRLRGRRRLAAQILFYPITDNSLDTSSYLENRDGYFLSREAMRWFWGHYLVRPEESAHPDASPLKAKSLAGLPATYLLTAGYDPLRDDGRAYAARLVQEGVSVHFVERTGLIHGFMRRLNDFPAADAVIHDVSAWLKTLFA